MNSFRFFLQFTFRLQQFFTTLYSSNFAHIPTLGSLLAVIFNGATRLLVSLLKFEYFRCQFLGRIKRKSYFWDAVEQICFYVGWWRVCAWSWIVPKITPIVFRLHLKQVVLTPLSLLCAFKIATQMRLYNFTVCRTLINFVIVFCWLPIFCNMFSFICSFR